MKKNNVTNSQQQIPIFPRCHIHALLSFCLLDLLYSTRLLLENFSLTIVRLIQSKLEPAWNKQSAKIVKHLKRKIL